VWEGILDGTRAIDWSVAGVTGGIPIRETIYASFTSSATAAQIQTALDACPSGQVVSLTAGTYSLSAGLTVPSNVTLRGAGADQTILGFTGSSSYFWGDYLVGFIGNYDSGYWDQNIYPAGAHTSNLKTFVGTNGSSGVYTQGATLLDLGSTPTGSPNLAVGDMLQLVQDSDVHANTPMDDFFIDTEDTEDPGVTTEPPGLPEWRTGSPTLTQQHQNVKVTAIDGVQVTVTPGLHMPNWATGKNPKAYWWGADVRMAGIEDLAITTTTVQLWGVVQFWQAADCWMRGVRLKPKTGVAGSGNNDRAGIHAFACRNLTIRDCYWERMVGGGASSNTSYGIELNLVSSSLVENNIFFEVESPIFENVGSSGNVYGYNHSEKVSTVGNGQTGFGTHDGGAVMSLWEGNNVNEFKLDNIHGTVGFLTVFRNRLRGDTSDPPVDIEGFNRVVNLIGNVLGTSGAQTLYGCGDTGTWTNDARCDRFANPGAIYRFGYPESTQAQTYVTGNGGTLHYDPQAGLSAMRWGNYDIVTDTVRWESGEVPTAWQYANAVPGSQILPNSFYLLARPSAWWKTPYGTPAWPPIGPDVTGGDISGVAGHANKTPAQLCYENVAAADFNAGACYRAIVSSGVPRARKRLMFFQFPMRKH